jgi:hypothetical protein
MRYGAGPVQVHDGIRLSTEEKVLTLNIKPGWKTGTKLTFAGEGDRNLGTLPGVWGPTARRAARLAAGRSLISGLSMAFL